MPVLQQTWVRVTNDIVHDLSAGAWPGAALAMYVARNAARTKLSADAMSAMISAMTPAFLIMVVALALLVVTGGIRLYYRGVGLTPEQVKARNRPVSIKHVVFVVVFIWATVSAFSVLSP